MTAHLFPPGVCTTQPRNWPEWYAAYMVERTGAELPE
jgi:hypothetical protein